MTIGIAVILPGAALVVADGRTTEVQTSAVVSDNTVKIQAPSESLMTLRFGVTVATDEALRLLHQRQVPGSAAAAVQDVVTCISAGWHRFMQAYPDAPWENDAVRAALLIAGIDSGRPYLGGAMADRQQGAFHIGPAFNEWASMVLGAERHGSSDLFIALMNESRKHITPADDPLAVANRVLEAAAETVRRMAAVDRAIGGQTHYRILLASGEAVEGNV